MPQNLKFLESLATVHIDPASTDGRFALLGMLSPSGDRPPLHVHADEDEGFHVVEGELTLWVGDGEPVVLGPGRSVVAPHGVPHTYKVTSETPVRMFVSSTPGHFAKFVMAYGEPTDETELTPFAGPPDLERLESLANENGIQLLGPPGALPNGGTMPS